MTAATKYRWSYSLRTLWASPDLCTNLNERICD